MLITFRCNSILFIFPFVYKPEPRIIDLCTTIHINKEEMPMNQGTKYFLYTAYMELGDIGKRG